MKPTLRLQSIDTFRALTMLLMIFVNDVSGVHNIPAWIDHVEADVDGMGFADTIFPAFLFIVGLSLPFAIQNRLRKGQSFTTIAGYILLRSLALLVMGFFHVNLENYSEAAPLPHAVYTILLTIGFFLIWLDYPKTVSTAVKYTLIEIGIVLLLLLAWLFKGGTPASPEGLKPHWWGILGIIGWAYLICALLFLFTKGKLAWLVVALALLVTINITIHAGLLHTYLWVIGDASSASLVMMGVVTALIYTTLSAREAYPQLWVLFAGGGSLFIITGHLIRPYTGGISKIHATPSWVFICAGISLLVFALLIWLTDVKGKSNWFRIIRPAGTSTLTCYLLPYFLYSIYALIHFHYPSFMNQGTGGILRSFLVAFVVVWLTGLLEKKHIRLKI